MIHLNHARRIIIVLALAILVGGGAVNEQRWDPSGGWTELRLVANLPAYRLDVYENGSLLKTYPIAIGEPKYGTPRGAYSIKHVVWNPWWHPPSSSWARGSSPTSPGPNNPMGRAKLYFEDLYYIHGTSAAQSLGTPASHGCLRMTNEDVIELGRLVHSYGSPGLPDSQLNELVDNPTRSRQLMLPERVSLDIVYEVVEVRDGKLELHPDVYGLVGPVTRKQAMQALMAAGYDVDAVDEARLAQLVESSKGRAVSVPVESLYA